MSPWVITVLLALALAVAVWRIFRQKKIVRELMISMRQKRGFIRDSAYGLYWNREWKDFIDAANSIRDENKRLEADRTGQVERLKATLANMQEAVLIIDDDNRVLLANTALRRLFSNDNFENEGIQKMFRNSNLLRYIAAVRNGKNPGRQEVEFARESAPLWTEISASRISGFGSGAEDATLLVLHDTTRMRHLESVRKEFVANVSHELRTPLSLIKGYVDTLAESEAKVSDEERCRFMQIIQKHTIRLERLVEDLLALSRLESGNLKLRKEKIVLESLIEEIVENFRSRADADGYKFEIHSEKDATAVFADPSRIAQVIANLLENAIKHSGGDATIEAGIRRDGDVIKAWVRDNGVGISEKDLPHIFERFYRVDKGRSRENGGTGLGLSIVKHIIQLHGGTVWADSKLGGGTCIYFTLPLSESKTTE